MKVEVYIKEQKVTQYLPCRYKMPTCESIGVRDWVSAAIPFSLISLQNLLQNTEN
jgi:hypothetical protein